MKLFRAWLFLGLISACSSDNSPADGGTDATTDVTQKDVANDTKGPETGTDSATDALADVAKDAPADVTTDVTSDASDGGGSTYTLTINDYLNWCNVGVNGADAGSNPPTYQFAPDASVALHGDTVNSSVFYWGYWQSANLGDGGKYTNKDETVTMSGNVTVLACCPFNDAALSCP